MHTDPVGLYFCGGFKDCARLHLGNFRKGDPEPATAMPEHRIEFVQLVNTARDLFNGHAEFVCQFVLLRVIVRQKLVQWGIEKANRGRQTS